MTNKTINVREINEAVRMQAMRGTPTVRTSDGLRVIRARTVKGQLQVKLLSGNGQYVNVEHVVID